MRLALSEGVTLRLSKVGRIWSKDRHGFATYQPTGMQLLGILRAGYADQLDRTDEAVLQQLRAMHAECSAGLDAAPAKNNKFWRESMRSIREAIQTLQGSPEMWGAIVEAEHYESLPEWAREELGRPSALNRDLRLMYRGGLTTDEAGAQLRALVAAEERRREFAKEVA